MSQEMRPKVILNSVFMLIGVILNMFMIILFWYLLVYVFHWHVALAIFPSLQGPILPNRYKAYALILKIAQIGV